MSKSAILQRGRRLLALVASATIPAIAVLGGAASQAQASPYWNTDPYLTGCGRGAYVITSHAVPGGTAFVAYSPRCNTNWVEYSGSRQWTTKSIKTTQSEPFWTNFENDYAGWSYSMQVYAPGDTQVQGYIRVQGREFHVWCSTRCNWHEGLILPG